MICFPFVPETPKYSCASTFFCDSVLHVIGFYWNGLRPRVSDIPWWNLIIRASEVTWLLTWRLPRSLKHLSILLSWPQAVQIFDLEESFCYPHLLMIVFTICQRHPSSYWHYEWLLRICYQHSNVVKDALTKGDSQYSNYVSRVPIVWMQP